MRCPFPGIDPYLERPEIWPDFHDGLIIYIREALQPLLRPRYAALTRDRLYVVERERPIWPDVSVVRTSEPFGHEAGGTAVAVEPDEPQILELHPEEVRETLIHIIEPAAGNRVVTSIEILSPDNKVSGPGRDSYLQKRDELWQAGANLVEIDLLRGGKPTVKIPAERLESPKWRYLVAVTRRHPSRYELYAFPLEERLPRARIPLAGEDPDVTLDLQAVYQRCWDAGPYPELLRYDEPPPGSLDDREIEWCREILRGAGAASAES